MHLNFKHYGEGQPIIIMHGLLGSLDNWQSIAKTLAEDNYQVYTLDLRNHGKSPHSEVMNYQAMSNDLLEFITYHNITEPIIIGHSMGGKTAMRFALSHPQHVKQLIVVDVAPVTYQPGHIAIFEALRSVDFNVINSRKAVETKLKETIKNTAVRLFLMKGLTRTKTSFAWKFNLESLWNNYKEIISGIESDNIFDKPSLFIKGGQSDYIVEAYMNKINRLFPNHRLHVIEGAGHWVHAEKPKAFINSVKTFISTH